MTTMLMTMQCIVCLLVGWYGRILFVRFRGTKLVKVITKRFKSFIAWFKRAKKEGIAMETQQEN